MTRRVLSLCFMLSLVGAMLQWEQLGQSLNHSWVLAVSAAFDDNGNALLAYGASDSATTADTVTRFYIWSKLQGRGGR